MLFETDQFTVTATGDQTFQLSHVPIDNSEHFYWNGLFQTASEWSRTEATIAVPDPDGFLKVGDEIVIKYAREA